MVEVSADVDKAAMQYVDNALQKMAKDFGKAADAAPKSIAYNACKSLASPKNNLTKQAPKKARPSEYRIEPSPVPPRYITYKNGKPLPIQLHRWRLTRLLGTANEYFHDYYAYAHIKRTKSGKFTKDAAAEKKELKALHIGISRAGLARKSWNWIAGAIWKGTKDAVWKRRKGEKRDPVSAVDGTYTKQSDGSTAHIINRLDYITEALKPMAIDEVMRAAIAKTAFNTARRQKMTIEEAKQYARELAASCVAA